jgi:hypothetical protein
MVLLDAVAHAEHGMLGDATSDRDRSRDREVNSAMSIFCTPDFQ